MATFSNSLGLIAYADSFIKISEEEKITKEQLPAYNSKETVDSIKAIQARVERQHAIRQRRLDMLRTTVLSLASVIFSFLGLLKLTNYNSSAHPSPFLTVPIEWVLTYPILFVALLIVAVASFILAWPQKGGAVPTWYIKIHRLLQSLPWQTTTAILLAFAAVPAWLFWRLLP